MIGNNIWNDDARKELLHIIPQNTAHGTAQIRGSFEALRRLGEALIIAANMGQQGTASHVRMMASDGEGYDVEIYPMSDQQMEKGPMPYAQLGEPWDFEACADCPTRKEDQHAN